MKTILAILAAVTVNTNLLLAGNIGTTSEWGIIYTACAWCGTTNGNLEIHHVWPQHVYPQYAHDINRMVVFCRRCHLVVGHRGNFTNVFTNVMSVILTAK